MQKKKFFKKSIKYSHSRKVPKNALSVLCTELELVFLRSLFVTFIMSDCFQDDSLGADAYWAAGLHVYTPLPFRPGRGGLGDLIKTHFFLNTGNLVSLDRSMPVFLLSSSISGRF